MKVKFYLTGSGRSPVEEFIRGLSQEAQGEIFDALFILSEGRNLSLPLSRNLSSIHRGLHEIRVRDRGGQIRVFYFVKKSDAIYLLHGMKKKQQKIMKKDIDLILKRIKEV